MNCSIELNIGSDTYKGKGETLLEALQSIHPKRYVGFGTVRAVIDGRASKAPLRLVPVKLQRIFEKPIEMELFAKRLATIL